MGGVVALSEQIPLSLREMTMNTAESEKFPLIIQAFEWTEMSCLTNELEKTNENNKDWDQALHKDRCN